MQFAETLMNKAFHANTIFTFIKYFYLHHRMIYKNFDDFIGNKG